jgi:hypothetical protein
MQVTSVRASVKVSKELEGAWKTIELGGEAEVSPFEDWKDCQTALYGELVGQVKTLWNGNSKIDNGKPEVNKPEVREHYCQTHGVEYKKFEKNGKSWYAHKADDGWCNER